MSSKGMAAQMNSTVSWPPYPQPCLISCLVQGPVCDGIPILVFVFFQHCSGSLSLHQEVMALICLFIWNLKYQHLFLFLQAIRKINHFLLAMVQIYSLIFNQTKKESDTVVDICSGLKLEDMKEKKSFQDNLTVAFSQLIKVLWLGKSTSESTLWYAVTTRYILFPDYNLQFLYIL